MRKEIPMRYIKPDITPGQRFYDGRPCKHCGGTQRYVSGAVCVNCAKQKYRDYASAHGIISQENRPPPEAWAERDRALAFVETFETRYFGDPPPTRSALAQKRVSL
jgi:hypothetical protein